MAEGKKTKRSIDFLFPLEVSASVYLSLHCSKAWRDCLGYHTVVLAGRYQGNGTSLKCISMNPVYRRTTSVNESPTTYARKRGDFRSPVTHACCSVSTHSCAPYSA